VGREADHVNVGTRHRPLRRARALALLALGAVVAVPGAAAGDPPDITPPDVLVSGATGAWSNAPSVMVSATADDPESGDAAVEFRTSTDDGATWTAPVTGDTVDVTGEGTTLVEFRATDNAANTSAWTAATPGAGGSVRLDRTGPTAPGAPPDQLPGIIAWFDASDASTITASGSAISRWADRSGHLNDATQTTPANRPTTVAGVQNGRAVVGVGPGGPPWGGAAARYPRAHQVAGAK
jgi:hypothetical protein